MRDVKTHPPGYLDWN